MKNRKVLRNNKDFSLSIIIPIFNEAEILDSSVTKIYQFINRHFKNFELIIIESDSNDGSKQIADKLSKRFIKIKVFHQKKRYGVGSALKLGYLKATKDFTWFVDLDIPFPLESIIDSLSYLKKYDCVLSYRSADPRRNIRKIQSAIYNFLVRIILGIPFKHINSAFKVYRSDIVKNMNLTSNGWIIEAEILFWIHKKGLSYIELPVPLIDRTGGKSKITILTFLEMLKELCKLKQSFNF